jgi:hypothetical protein
MDGAAVQLNKHVVICADTIFSLNEGLPIGTATAYHKFSVLRRVNALSKNKLSYSGTKIQYSTYSERENASRIESERLIIFQHIKVFSFS